MEWKSKYEITNYKYKCGYCNCIVGTNKGYDTTISYLQRNQIQKIYICPNCNKPTYFDLDSYQYPNAKLGDDIKNIDKDEVNKLYDEARNCFSVNSFTSVALCCRKLLMNVSVDLGAEENKSFAYYVNWMDENNYILPNAKKWVDQIRKIGNEATHEIHIIDRDDAEKSLKFTEMILKLVYEFPAMVE